VLGSARRKMMTRDRGMLSLLSRAAAQSQEFLTILLEFVRQEDHWQQAPHQDQGENNSYTKNPNCYHCDR